MVGHTARGRLILIDPALAVIDRDQHLGGARVVHGRDVHDIAAIKADVFFYGLRKSRERNN